MIQSDYFRLASLFVQELEEPTREALEKDARFAPSLPAELQDARVEYTRLFTLSVYPYASVFLDSAPELNGESTAEAEAFYRRVGFELPSGWMLGAADALAAELACLAWLADRSDTRMPGDFLCGHLLKWAPLCCLAVQRNARLQFYHMLAKVTLQLLLQDAEESDSDIVMPEDWREQQYEGRDLSSIVDLLIAPSRCGIYLSKQDMHEIGRWAGVPVGFGDRGLVLANLLRGAGAHGRVTETLEALASIVEEWENEYVKWVRDYPRSRALSRAWVGRAETTKQMLSEMHGLALRSLPED